MRNPVLLYLCLGSAWSAAHGQQPSAVDLSSDPVAPAEVGEVTFIEVPQYAEADIHINLDGLLDEVVWAEVPG